MSPECGFISPESKFSIVLRQTRLESRATVGGYFLPKLPGPACLGTISTKTTFRFGIAEGLLSDFKKALWAGIIGTCKNTARKVHKT